MTDSYLKSSFEDRVKRSQNYGLEWTKRCEEVYQEQQMIIKCQKVLDES